MFAVVWLYPSIWAITLAYITRNIPSLRCQLYTDDFEPPNSATGLLELFQIAVYVSRIFLIDTVCRILVVVICIASYRPFVNSTINPPEGLARLLPVLMTITTSVVNLISDLLLVGLNNGFGGITVTVNQFESSSFYYIPTICIVQLLFEYKSINLLIYLNQKLQSTFIEGVKAIMSQFWCKHSNNTVAPQQSQSS